MSKGKQVRLGVSVREIGRQWGCDAAYVSRFLKRAGIKPLPDGSFDMGKATTARERFTIVGRGRRNYQRRHGPPAASGQARQGTPTAPVCEACGCRYVEKYARNLCTPHPNNFCSASCEQDHNDGLTTDAIARRRDRGITPKKITWGERPEWTPPPRPAPIVHICLGCGGLYDELAPENDADDREKFCHNTCEWSIRQGLTQKDVRQHIRTQAAESGDYTIEELNGSVIFDTVNPDGTPLD